MAPAKQHFLRSFGLQIPCSILLSLELLLRGTHFLLLVLQEVQSKLDHVVADDHELVFLLHCEVDLPSELDDAFAQLVLVGLREGGEEEVHLEAFEVESLHQLSLAQSSGPENIVDLHFQ